jgi:hypothetical protein
MGRSGSRALYQPILASFFPRHRRKVFGRVNVYGLSVALLVTSNGYRLRHFKRPTDLKRVPIRAAQPQPFNEYLQGSSASASNEGGCGPPFAVLRFLNQFFEMLQLPLEAVEILLNDDKTVQWRFAPKVLKPFV